MKVQIYVGPPFHAPAFTPDALVVEDDTYGVLGADAVARERYEDVERLVAQAAELEPERPGSVRVRDGEPLKIHAIVHDLSLEPTWREEWIVGALAAALAEADRRRLDSLALPMLGTLHGSLEPRRFVQLFRSVLGRSRGKHLRRVWLLVPGGTAVGIFDPLREFHVELKV